MRIFEVFYAAKNEEKSIQMSAYMKYNFPFLGIQKPERVKLSKSFFKEYKKRSDIDWKFVFSCYDMREREFHYLAIDYLLLLKNSLVPEDIEKIETLITTNSWWDSVDSLNTVVGHMCVMYPQLKKSVISRWSRSDNLWLVRVAIIFQLKYKNETDVELLSKVILENRNSDEFFINKAIGWALREYSKTNKEWVREFLQNNTLSKLSVREAGKYL